MNRYYIYCVRGEKYEKLAEMSAQSVIKVDPDAYVRNMRMGPGPIMIENMDAQISALETSEEGDQLIFLDADTLVLRPMELYPGVDITATWRDRVGTNEKGEPVVGIAAAMPYNYGVLGARPTYATFESFIFMRERIHKMSRTLQNWYGNQVALNALAGPRPESGTWVDVRRIPWSATREGRQVTIEKRPCPEWNHTPEPNDEETSAGILHFKGDRLDVMRKWTEKLGIPWTLPEEK